jgi:hypothetical protein
VPDGSDPVAENVRLRAANASQREVIARQAAELEATNARIGVLETRLEAAMAQVAELSTQVAELRVRLGRDSSNCSVPPSSEGLRKKPAQPRQRGARNPGKQPGAEGRHLAQTATPDKVVIHVPKCATAAAPGWPTRRSPTRSCGRPSMCRRCGWSRSSTASSAAAAAAEESLQPGSPRACRRRRSRGRACVR